MKIPPTFAACCCLLVLPAALQADDSNEAVGWRGDGSGRFVEAEPPTNWSPDSDNIVWRVDVGRGYSSPVLCKVAGGDERIFLTAAPSDVICIEAGSGKILWRQTIDYAVALGEEEATRIENTHQQFEEQRRAVSREYEELRKNDPDSPRLEPLKESRQQIEDRRREFERQYPPEKRGGAGNAAATVVCDGQRVYALFGTGIATALTLDGERLWARHLEGPLQGFGHSASPIFAAGRLIVHIQSLTALDPQTGETQWRVDVPAKFGTPAVADIGGEEVLITPHGAFVAADDGRVLARDQFTMSENSPVVHDGVLYVHESGKVKAFQLPNSTVTPFEPEPLWETSGARDQRMASALYHEGLLYAGGRGGIMDVIDAETGKTVYRKRLDIGQLFSSPTLAGDLIFLGGKDGRTLVLRPGSEYDEVAVNESERYSTTPIFDDKRMYLRTDKYLYCIGK
ncbi:MAG: PQQ-binding-like beta-propeller repeat protein [Pirellulaceae bacterium]